MRPSNDQILQNGRIHTGRNKDTRTLGEGRHNKFFFFLNPRRYREGIYNHKARRVFIKQEKAGRYEKEPITYLRNKVKFVEI